jgi:hypothetical protein
LVGADRIAVVELTVGAEDVVAIEGALVVAVGGERPVIGGVIPVDERPTIVAVPGVGVVGAVVAGRELGISVVTVVEIAVVGGTDIPAAKIVVAGVVATISPADVGAVVA